MEPETIEQITKLAADRAVEKALEFLEKERIRQQKGKRERRLHNTKLLMRNYRKFKIHCEDSQSELQELQDPDSLEFLDTDELVIESVIKNKKRTMAMLAYIDRMLQIYQLLCEQSKRPEDMRRYKVLVELYISDEEKTAEEIAEGHKIDRRTVYKDFNKSCEALSSLVFGVDGVRLFD